MWKTSKNSKTQRAFTIPELLVIIAVIAILALLVIARVQPGRARARDAKRVTEVNAIRKAIQIYYLDKGHYPTSTVDENKWCSIEQGGDNPCPNLASELEPYLRQIPNDPLFNKGKEKTEEELYSYQYISTSSGQGYKLYSYLETRDPYEVYSMSGSAIAYVPPGGGGAVCGNGICETGETSVSCPADCGGGGFVTYEVISASMLDDTIRWYDGESSVHEIDTTADGVRDVFAIDLDGDLDADVIAASYNDDKIIWYENLGSGNFSPPNVIDANADGAISVYAANIGGDSKIDVLSASRNDDKIRWYENLGSGNFAPPKVIYTFSYFTLPLSVFAADLNGDPYIDVLSASPEDNTIRWYENDETQTFGKKDVHEIDTTVNNANDVFAADLDGDGYIDVLSSGSGIGASTIRWYKNDGLGNFAAPIEIYGGADGANSVFAADLNGDGHIDVLSSSYRDDTIRWYKNDGSGGFTVQDVIDANADVARSVFAIDLNGDTYIDVLSAASGVGANAIKWYKNDGSGNFETHTIYEKSGANFCSVFAIDLDE